MRRFFRFSFYGFAMGSALILCGSPPASPTSIIADIAAIIYGIGLASSVITFCFLLPDIKEYPKVFGFAIGFSLSFFFLIATTIMWF